jgi:hypothetical protein
VNEENLCGATGRSAKLVTFTGDVTCFVITGAEVLRLIPEIHPRKFPYICSVVIVNECNASRQTTRDIIMSTPILS